MEIAPDLPTEIWRQIVSHVVAERFSRIWMRGLHASGGATQDTGIADDVVREPRQSDVRSLLRLSFKVRHATLASLADLFGVEHISGGIGSLHPSAATQLDKLLTLWNWETTSHQEISNKAQELHEQSSALGAYSRLILAARHAAEDFVAIASLRVFLTTDIDANELRRCEMCVVAGPRPPPPAVCEVFFSRDFPAISFVQQLAEALLAVYLVVSHVYSGRQLQREIPVLRKSLLTMNSAFSTLRDGESARDVLHLVTLLLTETALIDAAILSTIVADPPQNAVASVDADLAGAAAQSAKVFAALLDVKRGRE